MEEIKEQTVVGDYVDARLQREVEYRKMVEELENNPELAGLSLREKVRQDLEFQEKSG